MLSISLFLLLLFCAGSPTILSISGYASHHLLHNSENYYLRNSSLSFGCYLGNLHLVGGSSIESNRSVVFSMTDEQQRDPAARAVKKLEMLRRSRDLRIEDFNDAICECWRGGRWDLSLDLYSSLLTEGYKPNIITYNAVLGACARGSKHDMAENIFSEMSKRPSGSRSTPCSFPENM